MDLLARFVGIWMVFVIFIAVGVEGANFDETCAANGDCKETNAVKCDSGTRKCICSDGFFRKTTAAECAAKIRFGSVCDTKQTASDQCSVTETECKDDAGTKKCLCKATYYSDGSTCQKRKNPKATCSGDECVTHASCVTSKCKCDADYTPSPTTSPTMCSGVVKFAALPYIYVIPFLVSMMFLLR